MMQQYDILIIDDEQVILDAVIRICKEEGYSVDASIDAKNALQMIDKNFYKIIICDIMMPEVNGFEFLAETAKRKISSPIIITTGYSTVENAVTSLTTGAIDFIPKPFTADELLNAVSRGIKYAELQRLNSNSDSSSIVYVPCPATYLRLGYASWVFNENTGTALIGATDLFIKTIEQITEVELLERDEEIVQGNVCAQIKTADKNHPLLSPISGRILEANNHLINSKNLIEKDPYFQGWFYRIIPSDSEYELKNLIHCSSDRN
jgi:DNA-binding response OmpR family regulator